MLKRQIQTICIFLGLLLLGIGFCACQSGEQDAETDRISTDVAGVREMFPALDGVQDCWWKYEQVGNNRTIGPANYKVTAWIKISTEQVGLLQEKYVWENAVVDANNTVDMAALPASVFPLSEEYWYNSEFEQAIMAGTWVGHAYVNWNDSIVYIVAENK